MYFDLFNTLVAYPIMTIIWVPCKNISIEVNMYCIIMCINSFMSTQMRGPIIGRVLTKFSSALFCRVYIVVGLFAT